MCGVFAYMGQDGSMDKVVNGLQRLEYRGYDSWGIAFPLNEKVELFKSLEPLQEADSAPLNFEVSMALGHTRWATHGEVNITNCHPHVSSNGDFALVHNGIVENFQALKAELLKQGVKFVSDTDSEVIVRLIEQALNLITSNREANVQDYQLAFEQAFNQLNGFNTLVLISAKQEILLGIRNGSPLLAGIEKNRHCDELFLASDYHSFAQHTDQCLLIDEHQMVSCHKNRVTLYDLKSQQSVIPKWQTLVSGNSQQSKSGYEHYMLKEISEQWRSINDACKIDKLELSNLVNAMNKASTIYLTGAGAAYFISEQIAFLLRQQTNLNIVAVPAYESSSFLNQMQAADVLIAVSQSGETADTLRFIQQAKAKKVLIASVVNMPGAMMSHLSDFSFFSHAGTEICVLSTKTSSSQLTFGYLLVNELAVPQADSLVELTKSIEEIAYPLSHYFNQDSLQDFSELAKHIKGDHLYLLGEGKYSVTSKIGALNIKEASYIHAEAFFAGELKHGVIALIEQGTPVICFVDNDNEEYMVSIASEVKARGGMIIGICQKPNPIFDHLIIMPAVENPASIITSIIPCQLLAYFLATQRGLNPDKPRNLAKSVTVI